MHGPLPPIEAVEEAVADRRARRAAESVRSAGTTTSIAIRRPRPLPACWPSTSPSIEIGSGGSVASLSLRAWKSITVSWRDVADQHWRTSPTTSRCLSRPVTAWTTISPLSTIGILDHLDAAMIAAVGDAHFERAAARGVRRRPRRQAERPERIRRPERPDQIAEPAEIFLEAVRNGPADQRRQADRGAVGEIVAVDDAEIDAAAAAGDDRPDRAVEVERNAQGAREAVGGAERQQGEDAVAVDQLVDRAGQRAVAAADDHHRRAVVHRRLDGRHQLAGVHGSHRPRSAAMPAPRSFLAARGTARDPGAIAR